MRTPSVGLVLALAAACGGSGGEVHGEVVPPDDAGAQEAPDASAPADAGGEAAVPEAPPLGATVHPGGATFRVWAPAADHLFVTGDFNGWNDSANELAKGPDGVFSGDVHGAAAGQAYAYVVDHAGQRTRKADPRARRVDGSRGNSILVDPGAFAWKTANFVPAPAERMIVYELHLGSFNPTTPG